MNKVILTGNLCKPIEVKRTTSGKSVVSNTIAVRRDYKEDGDYQTDFINIVVWGQSANYLAKYAHKGDRVELCGRWNVRTYTGKDGSNKKADECVVESIRAFPRSGEEPRQEQAEAPTTTEDELPF
jgi:single-strand DNA-binding protein